MDDEKKDTRIYTVVKNHEDQYSIWPAHKPLPVGWTAVGKEGLKDECLAYVEHVWTDMRPASLRRFMDGASEAAGAATSATPAPGSSDETIH